MTSSSERESPGLELGLNEYKNRKIDWNVILIFDIARTYVPYN